ncbi:uncharacterized protein LOC143283209 [Babylonia areolata]|uniref:uncharacterized protein LOC143283209 n=1 Tax=Babylonia areolata TaxID=304850 RepID=UPI003FD24967
MDNQNADFNPLHLADDVDRDPSSTQNADDSATADPSSVTETSLADQPHTTEDQDEPVDVKIDVKSLCQVEDATKSYEQLEMAHLKTPTSRTDPHVQFSNSSIVSGSENRNTHRKTGADMRILGSYMRSLNEMRLPENIPPVDLDKYLSSFFLVVRKTDGSEYEPCSLRAMLASIERYLRQKNYPASLTRDTEFSNMRNVLKLKQQMLRSLGKGQKSGSEVSQTAACVREGKITHLFQSHEMGPYNPNSVIFSLCFFFCMYLKLRKSTEHKKLLWGDIILCQDYNNREYLTFSPQMLSRIHSSQRLNHRLANARVWAEPDVPERDPVALYKLYAQKRPLTMNQPYAPFYLGLNVVSPQAGQSWYRPAAMGINKLNEMVRQIRDLTGLKSSNDTSPLQYLAPSSSQDLLPIISDLSNTGSDPSSSRDGHIIENSDGDCREVTPNGSPQLTIDIDESYSEPIDASTSSDQPLSLVRESDSSDEQSVKSPNTGRVEEKVRMSPSFQAVSEASEGGDVFQHQVANMNVARAREMLAQAAEEPDEEEDGEDFISLDQAKELVTDIIQRMDIMDMVHFDRWLKTMTIARDTFSGQIICKDAKKGSSSTNRNSSSYQDLGDQSNNENSGSESTNMNILLNIALTPSAIRGQGPITVQATTVSASDLNGLSGLSSEAGMQNSYSTSGYSHWNGTNDSPLNLALSSVRSGGGSASAANPHHASRVTSSSSSGHRQSGTSSSLAAAAGECPPAKQRRIATNDFTYHQPAHSKTSSAPAASTHNTMAGIRRPAGQYEGSRRKLNPAFLTHIKPRTSEGEVGRRVVVPLAGELNKSISLGQSNPADDEDLVHVLNLKQEVD